jgi:hypothetical protein
MNEMNRSIFCLLLGVKTIKIDQFARTGPFVCFVAVLAAVLEGTAEEMSGRRDYEMPPVVCFVTDQSPSINVTASIFFSCGHIFLFPPVCNGVHSPL